MTWSMSQYFNYKIDDSLEIRTVFNGWIAHFDTKFRKIYRLDNLGDQMIFYHWSLGEIYEWLLMMGKSPYILIRPIINDNEKLKENERVLNFNVISKYIIKYYLFSECTLFPYKTHYELHSFHMSDVFLSLSLLYYQLSWILFYRVMFMPYNIFFYSILLLNN